MIDTKIKIVSPNYIETVVRGFTGFEVTKNFTLVLHFKSRTKDHKMKFKKQEWLYIEQDQKGGKACYWQWDFR